MGQWNMKEFKIITEAEHDDIQNVLDALDAKLAFYRKEYPYAYKEIADLATASRVVEDLIFDLED